MSSPQPPFGIPKNTQIHVINVFFGLSSIIISAGIGSMFESSSSTQFSCAVGILIVHAIMSKIDQDDFSSRFPLALSIGFLIGVFINDILSESFSIDKTIVPSAFIGTCAIFLSFHLAAIFMDNVMLFRIHFLGVTMPFVSLLIFF